jgi:hypothetical protein
MQRMMKEMNKLGMGAKLGSKQKTETLRGMSPSGELASGGGGGVFGGGLGGLFGGGAKPGADLGLLGGGLPGGGAGGGLGGLFGGARPMGSSSTRKSGSKRTETQTRKQGRGR